MRRPPLSSLPNLATFRDVPDGSHIATLAADGHVLVAPACFGFGLAAVFCFQAARDWTDARALAASGRQTIAVVAEVALTTLFHKRRTRAQPTIVLTNDSLRWRSISPRPLESGAHVRETYAAARP